MLNFLLTQSHLNYELISSSVYSKSVEMQLAFQENTTQNSTRLPRETAHPGQGGISRKYTQGGPEGNGGKNWSQTLYNL